MNRAIVGFVVFCLSLVALAPKGNCQKFGAVTKMPLKKVDLHLNNATADDHIVQLARQADVNFIADATRFPEAPSRISQDSQEDWGNLLLEMAHQRSLTWQGHDENTFLFWADWQGDLRELAEMILARVEAGIGDKMRDPAERTRLSDPRERAKRWNKEMLPALTDYLKRAHGWDGLSQNFKLRLKMAELPPDLRAKVIARAQEELPNANQAAAYRAYFGDEFWNKAILKVTQSRGPKWWSEMHGIGPEHPARGVAIIGPDVAGLEMRWVFGYLR